MRMQNREADSVPIRDCGREWSNYDRMLKLGQSSEGNPYREVQEKRRFAQFETTP